MFSVVSVHHSVNRGGSHMNIIHDALVPTAQNHLQTLHLTVQSLALSYIKTWDFTGTPLHPLLVTSVGHELEICSNLFTSGSLGAYILKYSRCK